jgi:hypothetical protein
MVDVRAGHRPGDQLGDAEVGALQHEERAQVIRKLGMPVLITRYPLRNPTNRQNTSDRIAPITG